MAFLTGNKTGLAMLIRKKKVELHVGNPVIFSRQALEQDFLNWMRPRGFLLARGRLMIKGWRAFMPVRVISTHLNQPPQQHGLKGRHLQVEELMSCWSQHQPGEL